MLRVAAALLLLTATLAPTAEAEWASFRADSRNTAFIANSNYAVFEDVWWNNKTLNNAQVKASPVLKDQILITVDIGAVTTTTDSRGRTTTVTKPGLVRALDGESGAELWRHEMTAAVYSTPAISGERVYVADMKGVLRALNLRDGHMEHENKDIGAAGTQGAITINEGKLFIGTEDGKMRAFLASTLTPLWTFDMAKYSPIKTPGNPPCGAKFASFPIRSGPAVYNGNVFFGAMNNWFFSIKESGTGIGIPTAEGSTLLWAYQTNDVIVGSPTVNIQNDTAKTVRVVIGSYDGFVYSFSPTQSVTPAVTQSNTTYACTWTGARASPTPDNNVVQPVWKYQVPTVVDPGTGTTVISKVHSSPASYRNTIVVGANNGHVFAINAVTGQKLWETSDTGTVLEPITSSPVVANGIIVVGSENKNVYWIDVNNGTVLAKYPTIGAVQTGPAIDGVRAYVASQDGAIYMFGPEIPQRADLSIGSITATTASVSITVRNDPDDRGKGLASVASTLRLKLNGEDLATLEIPVIAPGGSYTATHNGAVPEGRVTIVAIADFGSSNAESDESNNEVSRSITVGEPIETDSGGGGGGGIKIPAPGLVPLLALLALATLAMRRRK